MLSGLFEKFRTGDSATSPQLGEVAGRARYGSYELLARPIREGNTWRVAGTIRALREEDGETATATAGHAAGDFIRVDTIADHEEAIRLCLRKARQLIDERGEGPPEADPVQPE